MTVAGSIFVFRYRIIEYVSIIAGRENNQFRNNLRIFHARQWQQASPGNTILLGDSHIQSLYAGQANVLNLGIGRETASDVLERLQDYQGLESARKIILCIGANDALQARTDKEFKQDSVNLLKSLPQNVPIHVAAIPPLASKFHNSGPLNARIARFNYILMSNCKAIGCSFIGFPTELVAPDGSLTVNADGGDHLHLSAIANHIWLTALLPVALDRTKN